MDPCESAEREQQQLERLLLEGLESDAPIEVTPEFWERKRECLIERMRKEG